MIIPDQIQLGGLTIKTVYNHTDVPSSDVGTTNYKGQEIILYTKGVHPQHLAQIYIHEVVHWILFVMCEHRLRNNEKFVEVYAHFFYQFAEMLINEQTSKSS